MSERNKDDIANALHGLASGDHVEPELPEGSGTGQAHHFDAPTPPPAPPPAPAPPASAGHAPALRPPPLPLRATPKPRPPSSSAPGSPPAPAPTRSDVPPPRPRAHPQPQPAPGSRPATSAATRATQQTGPARPESPVQPGRVSRNVLPPGVRAPSAPASPNLTQPGQSAGGPATDAFMTDPADVETTNVQPVDEDDRVIVPAAPLSSLGPRPHHGPAAPRVPLFKTLQFRRTAIPVLLTTGVLLLFVAALKFLVNGDAVLATMPMGMCLGLAGAGILLLCVAALNVTQVRQQLAAEKAAAAAPTR